MQGDEACYHGRHGGRNLRIACIGDMLLAIHNVFMDLGMKCFTHLTRCARYIDRQAVLVNQVHLKSMQAKPLGNSFDILLCRAEFRSHFLGGEPLMICARVRILQFVNRMLQSQLPAPGCAAVATTCVPWACCLPLPPDRIAEERAGECCR